MKRQVIKYAELLLVIIFAFLLWQSANRIIQTSQTENWLQPIIFFSLFFICWSLGAILIKNNRLFFGVSMLALIIPLIFTANIFLFGVIIVSGVILWTGKKVVQNELKLRIKISVWNSLRLERRFFVFAIALILTGQYYFGVNQLDTNKTLPEFKINSQQTRWATKILSKFDPSFKSGDNTEEITVDDFILKKINQDENSANIVDVKNDIPLGYIVDNDSIEKLKKQSILKEGRESISKMVEHKITGNEKMMDIFSEIINKKINKFMNVNVGYVDQNIPIMHWIFTGLLFLSIVSIGMFLSPFLIMLTWLLFKIMISVKFVSVGKKMIEVEVIE